MEYVSTTALAKELDITANDLFNKLKSLGWIDRVGDKWILTEVGKQKGGQLKTSIKYGEYIVWPDNITIEEKSDKNKLLKATDIGRHFEVSPQRLNLILSELGWIEKEIAGWAITKSGKRVGGRQFEHDISGNSFVLWPSEILENKSLLSVFKEDDLVFEKEITNYNKSPITPITDNPNFREKFPAPHRTKDGHYVRSRAEVIIDNALYDYKLAHAYERKLPIEEELYSDFFIPTENVYIEYWGMENDPKYKERKEAKIKIYEKYDFKLIQLTDEDIQNLDDHLPKKLLKFNIKVY